MKFLLTSFSMLLLALLLAACADETHYPVSGEECTAEDPVKDVDASVVDCAPGGF